MKTLIKNLVCLVAILSISPMVAFAKQHLNLRSSDHHHSSADKGSWQPLNNQPEFVSVDVDGYYGPPGGIFSGGVATQLQLTDGSVLVLNDGVLNTPEVWKLTPDINGSYVNGSWSQLASFPIIDGVQYAPVNCASAVLADGRVLFMGGEYNGVYYELVNQNLGAIYDPVSNTWTPLTAPPFVNGFADAASAVLPDGKVMIQDATGFYDNALLDPETLSWTEIGTSTKYDYNYEENWTLLPNGKVLVVDMYSYHIPPLTITTDQPGIGPFTAIPASGPYTNNVAPTAPIIGQGAVASPDDTACTPINPIPGKIGICYRGNVCGSGTITPNMNAAGAIAVIQISNSASGAAQITDGGNGEPYSCMISTSDGNILVSALTTNPNMTITITPPAGVTALPNNSEIYSPKTGKWESAGSTIVTLSYPTEGEIGPAVLRPDGTVFAIGSNYGNTAIFDYKKEKWSVGPKLPVKPEGQIGLARGPASLLPNGNVLLIASPPGAPPSYVFEFDGHQLIEQPQFPHATEPNPNSGEPDGSYLCNLMVLPTGQIMLTDESLDVEIYNPGNNNYHSSWRPVICNYPTKIHGGKTYKIEGIRFNGMSQANMFGSAYQSATNYPLVRITNLKTKHVFYCRTHNHSYMGVASDRKVHNLL